MYIFLRKHLYVNRNNCGLDFMYVYEHHKQKQFLTLNEKMKNRTFNINNFRYQIWSQKMLNLLNLSTSCTYTGAFA